MDNQSFTNELDASRDQLEQFARDAEQVFTGRIPKVASEGFNRLSRDLRSSLQKNQDLLDNFGDSVRKAFTGTASGFVNGIASNILNSTVFQPLQQGLLNPVSQGITGFLGSLFGGARANGGTVQSGRAYVVGERGPELFVPPQTGYIQPSAGGGAGRAPNVNITIQTPSPTAFQHSRAQIQAAVASAVRQGNTGL
jgi:hypothetical protein